LIFFFSIHRDFLYYL